MLGTWSICPHQFVLSYVLGIEQLTNARALCGSILHKVMEILAKLKLAQQNGLTQINNDIVGNIYVADMWSDSFITELTSIAFDYFTKDRPDPHKFNFKEIRKWVDKTLALSDPRKLEILSVEQFFELPLEIENIKLRGTVDLVTQLNENTISVIDYKTGKRMNWGNQKEKDYKTLADDIQLRIYHLAISALFPSANFIILTLAWINDGGLFTVTFSRDDIEKTKEILRDFYNNVKNCKIPKLKSNGSHFFCNKVCHYGKNYQPGNSNETICQFIHKEIILHDLDYVVKHYTSKGFSTGKYNDPGT